MIIFDLDDYYSERKNNAMDWLVEFKELYPDFKVTLFTILGRWKSLKLLSQIKSLDWIDLAAHGYYHEINTEVLGWSKQKWFEVINEYEKQGFAKVFKAPNWQMSKLGYQVLKELDWAVAIRKHQLHEVPEGAKYYCFETTEGGVHGHTWLMQQHMLEGMFVNWRKETPFGFIRDHLSTKE